MGDFTCDQCDKRFANKANVKRHVRQIHKIETKPINKTISCTVCSLVVPSRVRLVEHLQAEHSIDIATAKFTFCSKDDFNSWKASIERDTCSFFVSTTSSINAGKRTKFYTCHRSGFHRRLGDKRNLKHKGSNKINGTCPAHLKMVQNADGSGKLFVTYMSTHVGHTNDVGRLRLTADERKAIADQLQQGVPNNKILTNIYENLDPSKRLTYLTKKDLHNIKASFNLRTEMKLDADEMTRVENWVQKHQMLQNNPILGFKSMGKLLDCYPSLKESEFFLAYMNGIQVEIFQHYGDNIVQCFSTHGTNPYKIQLFTVMVVDDNCDGFPVAFLYSSSETEDVYQIFFQLMSAKVKDLSSRTFISDDEPDVYKAWVKVFGQPFKKLLNSANFRCDWNQNLISKILNQEKLHQVQSALYSLQDEGDPELFEQTLNALINKLILDSDTASFGAYFQEKYASRWKEWASCHRKQSELNTSGCVERWQQELKSINQQQRMDGTIRHLINCLNRKFSSIILSHIGGNFSNKLHQLRNCSSIESVELIIEMEELNKKWKVSPNCENEPSASFQIELLRGNNIAGKRELTCHSCGVAVHGFACSCSVAKIDAGFCAHLHYVCLVFGLGDKRPDVKIKSKSSPVKAVNHNKLAKCSVDSETNFELPKIINELKTFINSCNCAEQLEQMKQQCNQIKILIDDRVKAISKSRDVDLETSVVGDDKTDEPLLVFYKTIPLNVYTCQFEPLSQ